MKRVEWYKSDDGIVEGDKKTVEEYEAKQQAKLMEMKQERYDELSELIRNYVRDYGELKVRCKYGEVRYTEDIKCEDTIGKEEKKDIFNRSTRNRTDEIDWLKELLGI